MPHPRSHTQCQLHQEIHVNPGKTESHQRHSSLTKGEIGSAGRGQIELIKGVMLEISIDSNLLKREDILEKRF
jgi:hypothetical protein